MAKRIELEVDDVAVLARLLEDTAPVSVQRIWDALPIDATLRHLRWGGSAAYVLVDAIRDKAMPPENRISFGAPATIAYKPEHGELAFSYGQSQARDQFGNGWATELAVLEGDVERFLKLLARTQHEGATQLTIRRKES